MPVLVGVFELPGQVVDTVTRLKGRGFDEIETYSPAPFPEVDDAVDPEPSGVRLFTLIGGLLGVCTGFALTLWMSNDWQIVVGWKPFSSIPPYVIIGFELTILFGGLATALGLFLKGGLPSFGLDPHYSSRFSAEDFGVVVTCSDRDVQEIEGLMREGHALEVNLVES